MSIEELQTLIIYSLTTGMFISFIITILLVIFGKKDRS